MAQKAHPGAVPVPASSLSAEQTACLSTSEATPQRYKKYPDLLAWFLSYETECPLKDNQCTKIWILIVLLCKYSFYHVLQEIVDELMDQ